MISITCPKCGSISNDRKDIRTGWCGHCHDYTALGEKLARVVARGIPADLYKLECRRVDPMHVKFALYDASGANCGMITVLTSDVRHFIMSSWKGIVDWKEWEGQIP